MFQRWGIRVLEVLQYNNQTFEKLIMREQVNERANIKQWFDRVYQWTGENILKTVEYYKRVVFLNISLVVVALVVDVNVVLVIGYHEQQYNICLNLSN